MLLFIYWLDVLTFILPLQLISREKMSLNVFILAYSVRQLLAGYLIFILDRT